MVAAERSFLTEEQARGIKNLAERNFALKCLAVGCLLEYQVPVGYSLIDFLVINPNVKDDSSKKGTLVEVTMMPEIKKTGDAATKKRIAKRFVF